MVTAFTELPKFKYGEPEGGPGIDAAGLADLRAEIGVDEGCQFLLRRWTGTIERGLPVLPVLLREIIERLDEELLLGLEVEQHQAVRKAGAARHLGQGGAGKAALCYGRERCLKQLYAAFFAAQGARRAGRWGRHGVCHEKTLFIAIFLNHQPRRANWKKLIDSSTSQMAACFRPTDGRQL